MNVMDEPFVIKVQRPIGTTGEMLEYCVYPEDGSWTLRWPIGEQPMLDTAMRYVVNRYFWARLDDNGRLELLMQLPCDQTQLW